MRGLIRVGVCAACLLLVTACGWHLRGSQADFVAVTEINLQATDIYTPLYRTFKEEYTRRHITLGNTAQAPTLHLLEESQSIRVIAYDTRLDPAEEELTLKVHYQVNGLPFQMQLKKSYDRNTNRPAAQENEKEKLLNLMRRELAERILQHLSRIARHSPAAQDAGETLSR